MTTTEASRPVVAIPPDIHGFRRSVAVVIGIDAYAGDIPRLKSAANDATHLARLLSEQHHYDDVRLLTNEQASCAALRKMPPAMSAVCCRWPICCRRSTN